MAEATYYLLDDDVSMPRWCRMATDPEGGVAWIDMKGRRLVGAHRPVAHVVGHVTDTVRGVPEVVADFERARAMRFLLKHGSDQGWIAPDGRFFGCGFFHHDDLAHALLRKEVGTLEREGWIRVHADSVRSATREPTRRQVETLSELGFYEEHGLFKRLPERLRQSTPPRRAVVETPIKGPPDASERATLTEADVREFVDSLATRGTLPAFEAGYEVHLDFGGRWIWMAEAGDVSLGSEECPKALAASTGLSLFATAFDQVEVSASPDRCVRSDEASSRLLAARGTSARP